MSNVVQQEIKNFVGSFVSEMCVPFGRKSVFDPFEDEFHKTAHISVESGSAAEEFIELFNKRFGLDHHGFYPKTKQILSGCWAIEIWYDPKKVH